MTFIYRIFDSRMSMKFSIIIPTYNNSEYLKVCLHSLLLQDFPKSEYEIIVVDDASTKNTSKFGINDNDASYSDF